MKVTGLSESEAPAHPASSPACFTGTAISAFTPKERQSPGSVWNPFPHWEIEGVRRFAGMREPDWRQPIRGPCLAGSTPRGRVILELVPLDDPPPAAGLGHLPDPARNQRALLPQIQMSTRSCSWTSKISFRICEWPVSGGCPTAAAHCAVAPQRQPTEAAPERLESLAGLSSVPVGFTRMLTPRLGEGRSVPL